MHDLGTLPGTQESVGNAINNLGQVVGDTFMGSNTYHAFFYNGTMHDMGTLPGGNVQRGQRHQRQRPSSR